MRDLSSHLSRWPASISKDQANRANHPDWTRNQPHVSNQALLRRVLACVWFANPMPRPSRNLRKRKGRSKGRHYVHRPSSRESPRTRSSMSRKNECSGRLPAIVKHGNAGAPVENESSLQVPSAVHVLPFQMETMNPPPHWDLLLDVQTSFSL